MERDSEFYSFKIFPLHNYPWNCTTPGLKLMFSFCSNGPATHPRNANPCSWTDVWLSSASLHPPGSEVFLLLLNPLQFPGREVLLPLFPHQCLGLGTNLPLIVGTVSWDIRGTWMSEQDQSSLLQYPSIRGTPGTTEQ